MDPQLLDELAESALTLVSGPQVLERLYDPDFHQQTEFIKDPAKLKALFCTRRAAKSYTAGLYLVTECLKKPGVNCLFVGLTKDSAKGIIWKDILKVIDQKNNLGIRFMEGNPVQAIFPNGSVIWITGIDANSDEMNKVLGRKYKIVFIDEGSMYSIDLRLFIYGILKPAMADEQGTICIGGTASNITDGLFFDITNGKESGWKLFQWTANDNPHVKRQWKEELDEIQRDRPLFKETALFKQWYLNQWVIDEDAKVYKFDETRNVAERLPADLNDWNYVLGVDLAHSPDSTAFVVGAYHDLSPTLYLVYAFKQLAMDITDVAAKIKELERKYTFQVKVVDGANKQAVAELNNRHGTNLIPADKTGKVDFIKLMNDELIQGKIKLLPGTDALYNPKSLYDPKQAKGEYQTLIWETDGNGKVKEPRKEHPTLHNDASDCALYLWRYCFQYLFTQPLPFQDKSKQEIWESLHIQKLQDQVRKESNPNELEMDWDEAWDEQDQELM